MNKFLISKLAITGALMLQAQTQAQAEEVTPSKAPKPLKPPAAFTTNCVMCHAPDQDLVGPSLIEIANIYPEKQVKEFVAWCIEPGRKRPDMPVMPGQGHIPKEQLREIHAYILTSSAGKEQQVKPKSDLFKKSPSAIARPRITRTFLPNTGPASMVIALPTSAKHNFIWDTDTCELRYISIGEIDNFPYLKGNGNTEANPGKELLTTTPLFTSEEKRQFKGYAYDPDGFPTLTFSIGDTSYTEKYTVSDNTISRVITSSAGIPDTSEIKGNNKLGITSKNSEKFITITYKPL